MPYLALAYFTLLLSGIALFLFHVKQSSSWLPALFLGYLAIRTAFVFWLGLPQPTQLQLDKGAALFLLQMVAYWGVGGFNLRRFFIWFTVINTLATFYSPEGLLGNPSINGTFLACAAPFFFKSLWVCPITIIGTIFLTGSSIPIGVLAVTGGVYFLKTERRLIVVLASIGLLFGSFFVPDLLSSSGRFEIWRELVPRYLEVSNVLIGTGGGSYQVLGPLVQSSFKAQWLHFFMHSDWLQVLLEFGIIGLALSVALYVNTLRWLRDDPELFAVAAGLGSAAIFNWPMHHPLTALLSVWVFRKALCR